MELHEIIMTAEIKIAIALKNIFLKNFFFSFWSCMNTLSETQSFIIFSM